LTEGKIKEKKKARRHEWEAPVHWLGEGKERRILSNRNMHNPPASAVNKILVGVSVLL